LGSRSLVGMGNFKGKGAAHGKVWGLCAEIPFGMLSWMNPRKHTLDEGSDHHPCARAILRGQWAVLKRAEPIEMPFGMLTQVGPRKHVFDGVHIGAT